MTKQKITLRNDFHGSAIALIAKNNQINANQLKRARKALCGLSACTCGGIRGPQDFQIELSLDKNNQEIIDLV